MITKSLYKFLSDNLSYFVTYDSNESNLTDITEIQSKDDVFYTGIPLTTFTLYSLGGQFVTDVDLVGKTIRVEVADGEYIEDTIKTWNNITGVVVLDNGFSEDILSAYKMSILSENLIYINLPKKYTNPKSRLISMENFERMDLYVKQKNDSNKEKINNILQNIQDLIFSNRGVFIIYNEDYSQQLGYAKIKLETFSCNEIINVGDDLQSSLVSFMVSYHGKYI